VSTREFTKTSTARAPGPARYKAQRSGHRAQSARRGAAYR